MKGTKANRSQRAHQWRSSLRQFWSRNTGSRSSKTIRQSDQGGSPSTTPTSNFNLPQIPASVWITGIFPFLDRWSQNRLRAAHREIFLARNLIQRNVEWPADSRITILANQPKLQRAVLSLQFSACSQHLLATMSRSKQVLVYEKWSGPQQRQSVTGLGHTTGHVAVVRYSPDGSMLATAGSNDGLICLWKVVRDDESNISYDCFRAIRSYQNQLRYVIWSRDGTLIAAWGQEGFVRVIRVQDGRLHSTFWKTRLEVPNCLETVSFCPPSLTGTPSNNHLAFAYNNEVVRLWNFETDTFRILPGSLDPTRSYDGTYITSLAYSPNGAYLAVGCHVATIKLWLLSPTSSRHDDNTSPETNDGSAHHYDFLKKIHVGAGWSAVALVQFTPDSQYVACTGLGSQIRLIQLSTGTVVGVLDSPSRVETLCFSPNAHTLASGGRKRVIRLWDTRQRLTDTPACTSG